MMSKMKKWAACLLAVLMVIQMVPVVADETVITSGTQGPIISYRDKLEISGETSIIIEGSTLQLTATEGYDNLSWSSSDTAIATVDENGEVTAIGAGTVKITAQEGEYSDSVKIVVVAKPETEETPETEESDDAEPKPAEEKMIIVIAVNKDKITYDGQAHTLGYTATSNRDDFDAEKVAIQDESALITKTDCGVYRSNYEAAGFTYEGNENVDFIVSEGWMQIKPATVTVQLGQYTKMWGNDDPDFAAGMTVDGLQGEDTVGMLNLQIVRDEGEDPDFYTVRLADNTNETGNYRVSANTGILVIESPRIKIKSSMGDDTSAIVGTEVVLTVEIEKVDMDKLTFQWQVGDNADGSSMVDIEGANEPVYTYILDEETEGKYFRVLVDLK